MLSVQNRPLWWLLGGTTFLLAVVLYVPFLQELFRFETLEVDALLLSLGAGLLSIPILEIAKRLPRRIETPG
jgi:Ca2+-transporting ATPase